MSRKRKEENDKRVKVSVSINSDINDMFDLYMIQNNYEYGDKSRLIENLIKKELDRLALLENDSLNPTTNK
jgi:hypothetical protein